MYSLPLIRTPALQNVHLWWAHVWVLYSSVSTRNMIAIAKSIRYFLLIGIAVPSSAFLPSVWSIRSTSIHGSAVGGVKSAAVGAYARGPPRLTMRKEPAEGRSKEVDDPRKQALDGVLHQIERCYGRGSILKMGDTNAMNVETTSTGNMSSVLRLFFNQPSSSRHH